MSTFKTPFLTPQDLDEQSKKLKRQAIFNLVGFVALKLAFYMTYRAALRKAYVNPKKN